MNDEPLARHIKASDKDPSSGTDSGQPIDQPADLAGDGINIAHLQRLARLALEPAQAKAAHADLHNIVAMIDAMQAVPTDGVEPLTHPLETPARLRPDQVTEVVDREVFQRGAPATDAGFYLVPKVIE